MQGLGLIDEWLGVDIGLSCNRPTDLWTFPIHSVSQSEGGFEAVHQSVVVMPHWLIQGDAQGRWGVTMTLAIDTSLHDKIQGDKIQGEKLQGEQRGQPEKPPRPTPASTCSATAAGQG